MSALQCGASGALNENMLVEGCIRCLSTHGKKKDMLIQDLTVASSKKKKKKSNLPATFSLANA